MGGVPGVTRGGFFLGGSQLERGELEGARRQRDLEQRHQLLLQQVGVAWGGRGLRGRGHLGGVAY